MVVVLARSINSAGVPSLTYVINIKRIVCIQCAISSYASFLPPAIKLLLILLSS